jgi:Mrp family chromosome partitioning ATPase
MPAEHDVMTALSKVNDPELHRNLVELNMIRELKITPEGDVSFTIALTVPTCPMRTQILENATAAVKALPGVQNVKITFGAMTDEERRALMGGKQRSLPKLNEFNQVKHVIAVMSGKGGVGKSSVTAMLACALSARGLKVGILDADVTGPSIPKLFGLPAGGLRGNDLGMLPAVTQTGIKVVSTNLLLKDEDTPVVWRGPVISATIQQFWNETLWGKLDYLLVDLPPGTSDAALAVLQNLPLTGVVLVTTPQDLAAMVVRKAIHMIRELNIPILGVVENMSYFRCPDTGKEHAIFGPSHVDAIASATGIDLTARLPIDPDIAVLSDAGRVEEVSQAEMTALAEKVVHMENTEHA